MPDERGDSGNWIARSLFITSTFRDLHAERDYLRDFVFPELEERLRDRRCHFEPIDLRWGVDAREENATESREFRVLTVCLAEIERSRPFLVGILGDRYGWIPPDERIRSAAQEAGFEADLRHRSVTELEIDFGVLARADRRDRCFFYFREPLPYDRMPPEIAATYSESHCHNAGATEATARLIALKRRIQATVPDRIRTYRATWDPDRNEVTGLEDWGRQVLNDLWEILDADTRDRVTLVEPTWQGRDRFLLDQFIEGRARDFQGRDGLLSDLVAFCVTSSSGDASILCLTGEAGSGKSAVFAVLSRRLAAAGERTLVLAHSSDAGPLAGRVDSMVKRWCEELAAFLHRDVQVPDGAGPDEWDEALADLLGQAAAKSRIVLLLDAVDRFEDEIRGRRLTWLPRTLPGNAKLVCTSVPGPSTAALLKRADVRFHTLEPLTPIEAGAIAEGLCRRLHRTLPREVLSEILRKRSETGAFVAGNPLWLELAVSELNSVEAEDFARADAQFAGSPEERLVQLLTAITREMPGDIPSMYARTLERAESLHGTGWTRAFVHLLAVSRSGLRDLDLRVLMSRVSGERWEDLRFATLRRTFRGQIRRVGASAQWDFSHPQLRAAVQHRGGAEFEAAEASLHKMIAEHLQFLPAGDPLRTTETMVHWLASECMTDAARYYSDELDRSEGQAADQAIIDRLRLDSSGRTLGWLLSLPRSSDLDIVRRGVICGRYARFLTEKARGQLDPGVLLRLIDAARLGLEDILDKIPAHLIWRQDLAFCVVKQGELRSCDVNDAMQSAQSAIMLSSGTPLDTDKGAGAVAYLTLGESLLEQGDAAQAVEAFRAAEIVAKSLGNPSGIAVAAVRLGWAYEALGSTAMAIQECNRAVAVAREHAAQDRSSENRATILITCLRSFGDLLAIHGRCGEALAQYQSALDMSEYLVHRHPDRQTHLWDVADLLMRVGTVHALVGDLTAARAAFERSTRLCDDARQELGSGARWQDLRVTVETRLAEVRKRQHRE